MEPVAIKNREGTYTLYDGNGDVVGRICTNTGRALIGDAFYEKVQTCYNVADDEEYGRMMFKCSKCGCELFVQSKYSGNGNDGDWAEPNIWVDGRAEYPKYCPNCRAIIIEE